LHATPVDSTFCDIARFSRLRRIWEHRIFGGQPAACHRLLFHPPGNIFFDGRATDDTRVAHRDEHRAASMRRDIQLETDGPDLIQPAAIAAIHAANLSAPAADATIYRGLCARRVKAR